MSKADVIGGAMPEDPLDVLLVASAPDATFDATARQRRQVIRHARGLTQQPLWGRRRLAIGTTLAFVVVGSGAAAAIANPHLLDFFQTEVKDPFVTLTYEVPSGATCSSTYGDVKAPDPAAAEALRDWLATADLLSLVDIQGALETIRAYDEYNRDDIGTDDEYDFAMGIAVVLAAQDELSRQGFAPGTIDTWKSTTSCEPVSP